MASTKSCAMMPPTSSSEFFVEDFCPELKVFDDHPWFVPIQQPGDTNISTSSHSNNPRSNYGRISPPSPCSDSNMSAVSSNFEHRSVSTTPSACSSTSNFSSAAQTVPATSEYLGDYGFQLAFDEQPKDTKSITWTYSSMLKKLFVRMSTSCPFKFRTVKRAPQGCIIRAMPVYMKPEHVQEVVKRCPNHATTRDPLNDDHPAPDHLVRCEHALAQYSSDLYSHRQSVTVPHEEPQAGATWVTDLYQFMCFSSCVGGLNRRPIQVVFTLEHQGQVLGRQVVEVRICACPGRDRRAEENAFTPSAGHGRGTKGSKRPYSIANTGGQSPALKKRKTMGGGSAADMGQAFTLTVHGRENYEMLCKIRDSLEIAALIPAAEFFGGPAMQTTGVQSGGTVTNHRHSTGGGKNITF